MNTRLIGITNSGSLTGFQLLYPSGAMDVYAYVNYQMPGNTYLLSEQVDPNGRTTTFVYNTNTVLLQYVIDCDGLTNTFSYSYNPQSGNSNLVSKITDPYGRSVQFTYYTNYPPFGNSLSNVIDPQGISTTFTYSDSAGQVLTNMTTPYGTTTFDFAEVDNPSNGDIFYNYCRVVQPDGGQQLFVFVVGEQFPYLPVTYTNTSLVPASRPVDNHAGTNTLDNPDWNDPGLNGIYGDEMNWADSYYWNRAQYTNLPSAFLSNPTNFYLLVATNYAAARMRHWNQDQGNQGLQLSVEQLPSPEVGVAGEMTWYDYQPFALVLLRRHQ